MDRSDASNVLVAFLVGAVAGGVTALLLAPASGEETRGKLAEGFKKAKDRTVEEYGHAKEVAAAQKDAIKDALTEGKEAYKKSVKKAVDK